MRWLTLLLALLVLGASSKADVYSGLVARYKFDGNGNDFYGQYNLTTIGTVPYAAGRKGLAAGVFSNSNYFSGTGTALTSIGGLTDFTFTHLVKLSDTTTTQRIMTLYLDASNQIAEYVSAGTYTINRRKGDGAGKTLSFSVSPSGSFLFVAFSLNGTVFSAYLNANIVGSDTSPAGAIAYALYSIGSNVGSASLTGGYLDDFRIYNRALSAAEIANIYATSMKPKQPNFMFTYPCFGCF